jgi:hypothetical protein
MLNGRRICIITTPSLGQAVGEGFLVVGNTLLCSTPDEPGRFSTLGQATAKKNTATAPRKTNRDPLPRDAVRRQSGGFGCHVARGAAAVGR